MSGRRKANPQDKVHPNKAEFIRAKYQMLAFVHRLPCRDDDSVTAKDLSKEKGNTPLHVASKAGQILQAELLAVYGADPGTQDASGKTPVDYASSLDLSELAKAAKKKLQSLSNHLFEELAMDVYDEVDRRETDADNVELILKTVNNQHSIENQDNEQPDYDSVASDEDTDLEAAASKANRQKSLDSDLSDGPVTVQEFMEVKNALVASEAKIQQLMKVNNNLSDELRIMQKKLVKASLLMDSMRSPQQDVAQASRLEKQNSTPESDYDNTPNDRDPDDLGYICRRSGLGAGPLPQRPSRRGSSRKGRQRSMVWQGDGSVPDPAEPHAAPSPVLPSTEDVIRKTEQITKNIQELLRAAQENKHDSAYRLQSECKKTLPGDPGPPTDIQLVTQQVIQCAYDIAKAAKQLVTITTKENN
ncbi:ARF GTPase-activating protein GIT2 isoform 7 [Camelus ferus]|nr:ARF GTPase-activating protein GIT2 isoform 7 [Camelus ferus]